MNKHTFVVFLAIATSTTQQCIAAGENNDQPNSTSYFEQMMSNQDAQAVRDGAACVANFLDAFARFFPKTDPRYTAVARLTEQCIMQRNAKACAELVNTVEEIFTIAQSRCAHEGMDPIFAVAKELAAIRYTHKGKPLDQKTAADKARLEKEMDALIVANECHLCSSFSDFKELLLEQDPRRAFYASEAHKSFYAHFLLLKKTAYYYDGKICHAHKAPFTIIVKAAQKIQRIMLSGKTFPQNPFSWLHYRDISDDANYKKGNFYNYTRSFKASYPKPKSRLQE